MTELLSLVAFAALAAVAWVAVRQLRPHALFIVRVRGGRAVTAKGAVTEAFLRAVAEACEGCGVQSGEVRGVPRGRRIVLWFSAGVPAAARQRLRNWWARAGWPARPG